MAEDIIWIILMKKNNQFDIYFNIGLSFASYFLIIYFLNIQLFTTQFFALSLFIILIIYKIISNKIHQLSEIYKSFNDISINIINKNKKHYNLDDINSTIKDLTSYIQNQYSDINKIEKTKTDFIGNVSHELKTPLFSLKGYIETLLDGAIDDSNVNREFLKKTKNQADRLEVLLSDLIKISMIQSSELKLNLAKVSLDDIINDIKDTFEEVLIKRGDKLILPESTGLHILADKEHILSVFNNLIRNAINYSDNGNIILSAKLINNKINIEIVDHGIGIKEEHLNRIFERFYRVDNDRSRQSGGTGLGLAIVKHILIAHDSYISIDSKPGIGSTFSFNLTNYKN